MTTYLTTDRSVDGTTRERHSAGQYLLATTPSHIRAERVVDALADGGFPVAGVRIVGEGLHSVEQASGRLTARGAAGAGAASGAWFGLLAGLLLEIRITEAQLESVWTPTTMLWGEHDPFGTVDTGKRIAALLHGRFTKLPGGGHLPWLDHPETAGRLVMELLASTEQPAIEHP